MPTVKNREVSLYEAVKQKISSLGSGGASKAKKNIQERKSKLDKDIEKAGG